METALGDPTVTAAVITTPTHLHHENQVLSCFIPSPQAAVHFYNIDIVDRQKKSRPTETYRCWKKISRPTKRFLNRQKDFLSDETDFSSDKCISQPTEIFSTCKKFSITFVHYGFPYVTRYLDSFLSFSFLFFFLGGGEVGGRRGSKRGSRFGVRVLYRPQKIPCGRSWVQTPAGPTLRVFK